MEESERTTDGNFLLFLSLSISKQIQDYFTLGAGFRSEIIMSVRFSLQLPFRRHVRALSLQLPFRRLVRALSTLLSASKHGCRC